MPTAEPASLTRALAALEREAAAGMLGDLVSIASVTGTPAETRAQHELAQWYADTGADVDLWPIDLAAMSAAPGFPGMEPRVLRVGG